jgi:putative spermidine/putrescine transport system permease protein
MADTFYRPNGAQWLLSSPALALFLGLLVVPLALTVMLSFSLFDESQGVQATYSLSNYLDVLTDSYYYELFLRTGAMALGTTLICMLLGVPEALILYKMRPAWQGAFFVVILGPLLISVVVRTLGWSILLGREGFINTALMALGLVDKPVLLMFSMTGVLIAMSHVMIPFMIISVWTSLQKLDGQVAHAARSLGAGPLTTFRRILLPQLLPGILSGAIIVFTLSASAFATPALVGGRRVKVVTTAIYDEFLTSLDWPLGAAVAVLLLLGIVLVVIGSNRLMERRFRQVFA